MCLRNLSRYYSLCKDDVLGDKMKSKDQEMFLALLQQIHHSQSRQVLALNIRLSEEISALCSAFLDLYPKALLFSDDQDLCRDDGTVSAQPLKKTREYLGLTTSAVLLDIRSGIPLDYLLSITATIASGGMLILLMQDSLGESESQRFHETAIPTPYFQWYFEQTLQRFAYRWQDHLLQAPEIAVNFTDDDDELESEFKVVAADDAQLAIKADFLAQESGVFTLFSTRGSGKSWLGAEMIADDPQQYILTAPNQHAIAQYCHIEGLQFRAPDALFLTIAEDLCLPETLIIEEAAKMPLVHLERLCRRFTKVLMISSVENYEGTGQGLREKIQDLVPIHKQYRLDTIKRFRFDDPLKQICDALSFQENESCINYADAINMAKLLPEATRHQDCKLDISSDLTLEFYDDHNISDLRGDLVKLQTLYHLLNQTHYQTNIQDLRRLFDAPSQVFVLAYDQEQLVGAIWAMKEGELSRALTAAVFQGLRRPKGNLVAQMLTGQSYFPEAMLQRSVRISRISVVKPLRRLGIGQAMIAFLEEKLQFSHDFMSVSFGLTADLLQFWESMDYQIAHLGFHLDKTTGLHSAVVLKDLARSQKQHWIAAAFRKFQADSALNIQYREYRPEIFAILQQKAYSDTFDQRDQQVIAAFQQEKRPKHTVENALLRQKADLFA